MLYICEFFCSIGLKRSFQKIRKYFGKNKREIKFSVRTIMTFATQKNISFLNYNIIIHIF